MGKMKEIAIECEGGLCFYCHKKIRPIGIERKNGKPKPVHVPDKEERWYHNACMKKRELYHDLKDRLEDERKRGLPQYY